MKKLLTLLLIFCFYTQSINSIYLQGQFFSSSVAQETEGEEEDNEPSKRQQKESERLTEELNEACTDDGTCDYEYNGMGTEKGDTRLVIWEQAVLLTIAFLSFSKMGKCVAHNAKWFGPNKVFKRPIKCIGWGEIAEIAAMTAMVTGEILQSVMVKKAIKQELDKREKYLEGDEGVNDEINLKKVLRGEAKIEDITGDLGALNDECRAENNLTEEERLEKCHSSSQLRPLRALRRILEKQLLTTKIKNTIYYTAASAMALVMTTDIIAAIKRRTVDSTELGVNLAFCSAVVAGTITGVTAPCSTACAAYVKTCPAFFTAYEAETTIPTLTCVAALGGAPLNKGCGGSSIALGKVCGNARELLVKIYSNVSLAGDSVAACESLGAGAYKKNDYHFLEFEDIFSLFAQKAFAWETTRKNKDKGQIWKFWLSIGLSFLGGAAGYFPFALAVDKSLDSWRFSNAKRAVMHGAQAGMITVNIVYTTKLKNRLQTEISEIDSYLNKLEASLGSPDVVDQGGRLVPVQEVGRDFESQFKQEFDDAFSDDKSPCPRGGDGKGGCLKMQPMMNQVIGGLNLDGLVGQTSNDVAKYADLMANKNKLNQNALKLGQKISSAKGPLDKLKKKLMKKYNAMRVKDGQKPINFEKLSANLLQTLKDKFFEATGKSANASVASLDKKAKKEKPVARAKKKVTDAEKKGEKAGADQNGFAFDFKKQKEEGISDGNVVDDTDADQYTVGDADITKGSSKDIFKVITTRYFKSAYPILIEELK